MLKLTEQSRISGIPPKKTLLSLKGIRCLEVIFVLIWMRQTLIWFNLQRNGIGNGLPNINDAIAESFQLEMSVLHQIMSILQSSRPFLAVSRLGKMWRKNTLCVRSQSKCWNNMHFQAQLYITLSFITFIIHQKGASSEKLVKDELYLCTGLCGQRFLNSLNWYWIVSGF